jgi:hypothetical protein
VIDISRNPYRLVESAPGAQGVYAALSYVWGGWESITTISTIKRFKEGIDRHIMPLMFQDLATVTQNLGVQWLWIDSICIIQDDEDDWLCEASKMADIYANASIVIAASSVPNPGTSFLGQREAPVCPAIPLRSRDPSRTFMARTQLDCGIHCKTDSETKDLLDRRGWAFQEKELACRWISYSASEVQWKCKTIVACECCTAMSPSRSLLSSEAESPQELYQEWHSIVQEYTSRKLTKEEDKLPALSGLAVVFARITNADYVAGMWKNNIIEDLTWKRNSESTFHSPTVYLAPTFSWASILGSVSYQPSRSLYGGARTYHSRLADVQITTAGDIPHARALNGWMILCGPLTDATLSCSNIKESGAYRLTTGTRHFSSDILLPRGGPAGCEFTIDSVLAVRKAADDDSAKKQHMGIVRSVHDEVAPRSFSEVPVVLLSLFTLVQVAKATVYENFLILGRKPDHPSSYQRIGSGTGKTHLPATRQDHSALDVPFLWIDECGRGQSKHLEQRRYSSNAVRIL